MAKVNAESQNDASRMNASKESADDRFAREYGFRPIRKSWFYRRWDVDLGTGWSTSEVLAFIPFALFCSVLQLLFMLSPPAATPLAVQHPFAMLFQLIWGCWNAFNIAGGSLCLSMPSCKRWYSTKSMLPFPKGILFATLFVMDHFQPFVIALLYSNAFVEWTSATASPTSHHGLFDASAFYSMICNVDWAPAVLLYAILVCGFATVRQLPDNLKRPAAVSFTMLSTFIFSAPFPSPSTPTTHLNFLPESCVPLVQTLQSCISYFPASWPRAFFWFPPVFTFKLVYAFSVTISSEHVNQKMSNAVSPTRDKSE
eukprot:ANDGO_04317.mRNA.1 hypothetical protein